MIQDYSNDHLLSDASAGQVFLGSAKAVGASASRCPLAYYFECQAVKRCHVENSNQRSQLKPNFKV
jgi:hypothetical protein